MELDMKKALDRRNQLKEELYAMLFKNQSKSKVEEKFEEFKASHKHLLDVCKNRDTKEVIEELKNAA